MRLLFYRLISFFGPTIVRFFAALVSTGYFFLLPRRTLVSVRFYRALLPERSLVHHLRCTWLQYQSFARVFSERLELRREGRIRYESSGWEHLEEAAERGGGVILMSHAGDWEVAARLLRKRRLRMMLYMGRKSTEEVERAQKDALQAEDLQVVSVPEGGGSPLDMLDGLRFLQSGGFVSMTGDRVWSPSRSVTVPFVGHNATLPDTPYLFAALARVPLFVFFSFRVGPRRYRIEITPPITVAPVSRRERANAVATAAQAYASLLEAAIRRHPTQWYHFESFLE